MDTVRSIYRAFKYELPPGSFVTALRTRGDVARLAGVRGFMCCRNEEQSCGFIEGKGTYSSIHARDSIVSGRAVG